MRRIKLVVSTSAVLCSKEFKESGKCANLTSTRCGICRVYEGEIYLGNMTVMRVCIAIVDTDYLIHFLATYYCLLSFCPASIDDSEYQGFSFPSFGSNL